DEPVALRALVNLEAWIRREDTDPDGAALELSDERHRLFYRFRRVVRKADHEESVPDDLRFPHHVLSVEELFVRNSLPQDLHHAGTAGLHAERDQTAAALLHQRGQLVVHAITARRRLPGDWAAACMELANHRAKHLDGVLAVRRERVVPEIEVAHA